MSTPFVDVHAGKGTTDETIDVSLRKTRCGVSGYILVISYTELSYRGAHVAFLDTRLARPSMNIPEL